MTMREAAIVSDANEWPIFGDCALPDSCECARRADPRAGLTKCAIPGINALAAELGWTVPYPHARVEGSEPPS